MTTAITKKTGAQRAKESDQALTEKFCELLDKAARAKVWRPDYALCAPYNAKTGRFYQGANVFRTVWAALQREQTDPGFVTFKQAQAAGGHVKRGCHGVGISFFDRIPAKDSPVDDDGKPLEWFPVFKVYTVFLKSDCEGCSGLYTAEDFPHFDWSGEWAEMAGYFIEGLQELFARLKLTLSADWLYSPGAVQLKGDKAICSKPESVPPAARDQYLSELIAMAVKAVDNYQPQSALHKLQEQYKDLSFSDMTGMCSLALELATAFTCARAGMKYDGGKQAKKAAPGWKRLLQAHPEMLRRVAGAAEALSTRLYALMVECIADSDGTAPALTSTPAA